MLLLKDFFKMNSADPYDSLMVSELPLTFLGLWPQPATKNTFFYQIRKSITYLMIVALNIVIVINCSLMPINFLLISEILTWLPEIILMLIKINIFLYNSDNVLTIYESLNNEALKVRLELQHYMQKNIFVAKMAGLAYQVGTQMAIFFYFSFILCVKKFLVPSALIISGWRFYAMCFFQYLGYSIAVIINASLDITLVSLIFTVRGQLKVLNENIRRYREFTKINGKYDERRETKELRRCIIRHQKIIELVERVEKVFSMIVLVQYLTSIILVCNIGFQLVIVDIKSVTFILMFSFFIAMMSQLAMYCWFGNEIILYSLAIRDACYESDWVNSSSRVCKMLIIIMERSKRPLFLTAGKFSVLSLTSFTSVINSAYSFFTLMQRMYGNT